MSVQKANPADIAAVLARRTARTPSSPAVLATPGSHVWAASGLVGWPGSSPANVFGQSGLRDAFASLRDKSLDPTDWVTTAADALRERS